MNKIILITGGARSGKSKFAEKIAEKNQLKKRAYIATAQIFDDEMAYRVKLHKARRNETWQTFESPFDADVTITELNKKFDIILFDCLTIYISNFVCNVENLDDNDKINRQLTEIVNNLINSAKTFDGTIIFVTNEVGSGIVPDNKLSRIYRDCAGITNQMVAAVADEVYLVVSGIPINIKKISEIK